MLSLVIAIAVVVAVRKMDKRKTSDQNSKLCLLAAALVVCVNAICFGVYGDTLNAALAEKKGYSEEAKEAQNTYKKQRGRNNMAKE